MMHWGFRFAITMIACLSVLAGRARAVTATFDDLDIADDEFSLKTLDEYKGLRWRGVDIVNGAHEFLNTMATSGYRTGIVSGRYVAIAANRFEGDAVIASPPGTWFDFNSVYLTAGWLNGLSVRFRGFRAGRRLYSRTVVLQTVQPTRFMFSFRSIDTLRITSSGGVATAVCQGRDCRPGPEVVMDDFSFSLVPRTIATVPPKRAMKTPVSHPKMASVAAPKPRQVAPLAEPSPGACPDGPYHGVQIGAFRSLKNALQVRRDMAARYGLVQIHVKSQKGAPMYRVVVGCMEKATPAQALLHQLRSDGVRGFVVRVRESTMGTRL